MIIIPSIRIKEIMNIIKDYAYELTFERAVIQLFPETLYSHNNYYNNPRIYDFFLETFANVAKEKYLHELFYDWLCCYFMTEVCNKMMNKYFKILLKKGLFPRHALLKGTKARMACDAIIQRFNSGIKYKFDKLQENFDKYSIKMINDWIWKCTGIEKGTLKPRTHLCQGCVDEIVGDNYTICKVCEEHFCKNCWATEHRKGYLSEVCGQCNRNIKRMLK